jgi:hypothetical protein
MVNLQLAKKMKCQQKHKMVISGLLVMDCEDFDWSVVADEKVISTETDGDTLHINYQTGNL